MYMWLLDCLYTIRSSSYCSPQYNFPAQSEVVEFAVEKAVMAVRANPQTLLVCGTYTIGKEKVFLGVCACVCVCAHTCMHAYVHACVCVRTVHVCMYVVVCLSVSMCAYVHVCLGVYVCMCVLSCVHACVCV